MKKIIAILLVFTMMLSLCACGGGGSSNNDKSSTSTFSSEKDGLTDSEIKSIVSDALYKKIDSKYDTADAGSCTFEINKTEKKSGYIYVYGKVALFDKYGNLTTGWFDESGSYIRNFTVKINVDTRSSSCDID